MRPETDPRDPATEPVPNRRRSTDTGEEHDVGLIAERLIPNSVSTPTLRFCVLPVDSA
jgi:hypothetical protein